MAYHSKSCITDLDQVLSCIDSYRLITYKISSGITNYQNVFQHFVRTISNADVQSPDPDSQLWYRESQKYLIQVEHPGSDTVTDVQVTVR